MERASRKRAASALLLLSRPRRKDSGSRLSVSSVGAQFLEHILPNLSAGRQCSHLSSTSGEVAHLIWISPIFLPLDECSTLKSFTCTGATREILVPHFKETEFFATSSVAQLIIVTTGARRPGLVETFMAVAGYEKKRVDGNKRHNN